jgi:hypothetical protein
MSHSGSLLPILNKGLKVADIIIIPGNAGSIFLTLDNNFKKNYVAKYYQM